MASVAVVFIVAPAVVLNQILNDPSSTMAVAMSLFPLFTPLIMPLRIALEMPPRLAARPGLRSDADLCDRHDSGSAPASTRVGILMYGKKPTLQEMWRWAWYS